ncbi:DNA repair protein [Micromonospora sp. NPDC051543]|uniref:DNA repair protein n=1 Tax=Micromonospora sp. NPDC051543 TaxID=3364287 RepID=UPI0037B8BFC9
MPIQPNDRFHQHPARLWRAEGSTADAPTQARYRMIRTTGALPWATLNELPAGSGRHGLNRR